MVNALMWRIKIPKKVNFVTWQNSLSRKMPNLMGPWCCVFFVKSCWGPWSYPLEFNFLYAVWTCFFDEFGLDLARQCSCKEMIKKILSKWNFPFIEQGKFLWQAGVCAILLEVLGVRVIVESLQGRNLIFFMFDL